MLQNLCSKLKGLSRDKIRDLRIKTNSDGEPEVQCFLDDMQAFYSVCFFKYIDEVTYSYLAFETKNVSGSNRERARERERARGRAWGWRNRYRCSVGQEAT